MYRCSALIGLVFCAAGMVACGRSSQPPQESLQSASVRSWPQFVDGYLQQYFVRQPATAAALGRHELDGQMPDWSAAGIGKQIELLEQLRARATAFTDESLTSEQRFQRDYLLAALDEEVFWVRDARQPFTNPAFYFDHGIDPHVYVNVPYAPVEQRVAAFIKYARAIPAAAQQIRANLQTPMPRTYIDFGVAGFAGLADFYRTDVPLAFGELQDAELKKSLTGAIEVAAQAMEALAQWLESQRPQANDAYALGAEKFAAMLSMTERVTTPLERLEEIGRQDLERNLQQLATACEEFAPDATLQSCVAKVAAQKPAEGPVDAARRQLPSLRQFVIDRAVVSVPGIEEAQVNEAPAYRRQNSAYIEIPGPYEKALPSVFYIAPPDPKWSKEEQQAYIPGTVDLLFTSVHEVWPGHFLQFLHSNRSQWPFGRVFVGYGFAEGWAHYAEELMVDKGLAQGRPEVQIGQLLNALLRNVRYVCAIGLHTRGMSVGECETLFREKGYQDAGNARQQAARGTYDPAYLNYTLGKLMIRKLRTDWSADRGGPKAWQQFHDQFLSYGGPPIPLVRARMMGEVGELF